MDQHVLISGRDALLVAIPFIGLLLLSIFRLDHLIATPKAALNRRRPPCGVDEFGEPILCDPDGRLLATQRSRIRLETPQSPDRTKRL